MSARQLLAGDREHRLKMVTAGVKMFERKIGRNGEIDYRLLQVRKYCSILAQSQKTCMLGWSALLSSTYEGEKIASQCPRL